jgi:hypothetical protein
MTNVSSTGLFGVLLLIKNFINQVIPAIISLTVFFFLFGLFKLVRAGDDSDARNEAKGYVLWGIIALFIMVSVWGLVNILVSSFNLDNTAPKLPSVPEVTLSKAVVRG